MDPRRSEFWLMWASPRALFTINYTANYDETNG